MTLLGQRLVDRLEIEKQNARLFGAMLAKIDRIGTWAGGPTHGDLSELRLETTAHAAALESSIRSLGLDPEDLTPGPSPHRGLGPADVLAIVTDPHTTSAQALHAILFAQLLDDAAWEPLVELCATLGHEELADALDEILASKRRQLHLVRIWLLRAIAPQATVHA